MGWMILYETIHPSSLLWTGWIDPHQKMNEKDDSLIFKVDAKKRFIKNILHDTRFISSLNNVRLCLNHSF